MTAVYEIFVVHVFSMMLQFSQKNGSLFMIRLSLKIYILSLDQSFLKWFKMVYVCVGHYGIVVYYRCKRKIVTQLVGTLSLHVLYSYCLLLR